MECSLEQKTSQNLLENYLNSEKNYNIYLWVKCSLFASFFLSFFLTYFIVKYQPQYSVSLLIVSLILFVLSILGVIYIKIKYKNVEKEKKRVAKKLFTEGLRVENETLITNEAHYEIIASKPDIL